MNEPRAQEEAKPSGQDHPLAAETPAAAVGGATAGAGAPSVSPPVGDAAAAQAQGGASADSPPEGAASATRGAQGASAASATPAPGRSGVWALIAGIAALLLALGAYGYTRHVAQQESERRQMLEERLGRLEQGARRSEESFQQLQGAFTILSQRLDTVQHTLGQVQGQVDELREIGRLVERLTQALAQQDERRLLLEARDALIYAQRRIDWANDPATALVVLGELDARLAKESRGLFLPLRQALARDLERLRAAPRVDLDGILARLDALESRLSQLTLAFAAPMPETAAVAAPRLAAEAAPQDASAPAESPWYRRAWQALLRGTDEVLASAAGLVRLERLDAVAPELLSPQQRLVLEENLRLWLASARLAAQGGDEARYRAALGKVRETLVRFYVSDDPAVASTLAALDELAAQPLAAHRVALTDSFAALAQIEARLQAEAAAASAP